MKKLKAYRSFSEFEHQELLKMDTFYSSIDEIVDEVFLQGLDAKPVSRRPGYGKGDGWLFDEE